MKQLLTKKLFISGGMSGYPEYNFPAFNAEAARLRSIGYEVFNPAEIKFEDVSDWSGSLRIALGHLIQKAEAIVVLPQWEKSEGAKREVLLALSFGLPIYEAGTMKELQLKANLSIHKI